MGSYSFSKKERLCGKKNIEQVFKYGNNFHLFPFKVLFISNDLEQVPHLRLAIIVGKRNFRKASDRNLLKRRIREAYRLNKHIAENQFISSGKTCSFLLIYTSNTILSFNEIQDKIILTLQRLFTEYEKVNN